jgi:hypothetical protein
MPLLLTSLPDDVLVHINSFMNNSSLFKTFKRVYKYRKVSISQKSKSFILSNLWPSFVQSFHDISQIRVQIYNPDEDMLLHLCKFHISQLDIYNFHQTQISNETMKTFATTVKKLSIHDSRLTDLSMFKNSTVHKLDLISCDFENLNGLENIHTLKFMWCDICTDVSMLRNVKDITFYKCEISQNNLNQLGTMHTLHILECIGFDDVSALNSVHNLVLELHCNSRTDLTVLKTVHTLTLIRSSYLLDICQFDKVNNLTIIDMYVTLEKIHKLNNVALFTVKDCKIFGSSDKVSFKRINKNEI